MKIVEPKILKILVEKIEFIILFDKEKVHEQILENMF